MQSKITFILISFGFLFLASCSNKSTIINNAENRSIDNKSYATLADYLRRNTNLQLSGVDPDIRIMVRGINSLSSDTRPFIYVDKTPIGRDYIQANSYVNPNDIARVKVISSLSQLTRYGSEGHSGVIIIYTKNGVDN